MSRHSGARAKRASPKSITTIEVMDSGPAHPSRLLPTWTMIMPNSGKPEFGGASRNDELLTLAGRFLQHLLQIVALHPRNVVLVFQQRPQGIADDLRRQRA